MRWVSWHRVCFGSCRWALALVALIASGSGQAQPLKNVNAGVIPYACNSGQVQFLLAYDPVKSRDGWGAFGGRPQTNETAKQTAVREFLEETHCVYTADQLDAWTGPVQTGRFFSFVARVPWQPAALFEQPRPSCVDVERSAWRWLPYRALLDALQTPDSRPNVKRPGEDDLPIWGGAAASLRAALAQGLLPPESACDAH